MQKYISKLDFDDIRYFDEDVNVGDWIDLSEFRLMMDKEIKKHETPKPSDFHVWDDVKLDWVDNRAEDQKQAAYLSQFAPLTRRQFRMVLVLNGYDLDEIKSQILAIEDIQTKQLTLIEWEDANTFERTSPSLVMMAELLALNDSQVNDMWKQALTL